MPKEPISRNVLYKSWIHKDPNFKVEGDRLFCNLCMKSFQFKRKQELHQHKLSLQHTSRICKAEKGLLTLSNVIDATKPEQKLFEHELVEVFLQENIPLNKLEKGPLRNFLEKFCPYKVPSVSTLRRVIPKIRKNEPTPVQENVEDPLLWVSVDQALETLGRNIANVVVEKLTKDGRGKGNLVNIAELSNTSMSTITQAVQEVMPNLYK